MFVATFFVLQLASATIAVQQMTDIVAGIAVRAKPSTDSTSRPPPQTDEALGTFRASPNVPETTLVQLELKQRRGDGSCKNHFQCTPQRKSTLSKGFPPVPSKDLVPPFADSEEKDPDATATTMPAAAENPPSTALLSSATSVRERKAHSPVHKRNYQAEGERGEGAASRPAFLRASKLAPAAARLDLSYLPPQGFQPAAASLDISSVGFMPPLEVSPAAAQTDVNLVKPDESPKDICSDSFHSFLCSPLRARKRITGALPSNSSPDTGGRPRPISPAASNAISSAVITAEPPTKGTSATTPAYRYAPVPSNANRSYLAPLSVSPSSDSTRLASKIPTKTTERPTPSARSFDRPFVRPQPSPARTGIGSSTTSSTASRHPSNARQPTAMFPSSRFVPDSQPSNAATSHLPPPSHTKRLPTTEPTSLLSRSSRISSVRTSSEKGIEGATSRYKPAPSNVDGSYLPPASQFEPAAAAQVDQAVAAPAQEREVSERTHEHEHHHDNHHHHHGKDLCSDAFHSFLCAPLKQRKRITGALPPGFKPESSNRKESRVKPEGSPSSERKLTKTGAGEETAGNAVSFQSIPYQYPKPTPGFPLPTEVSPDRVTLSPTSTSGYNYPKPINPLPLPTYRERPEVIPKEARPVAAILPTGGYQYPKPSVPFSLPVAGGQGLEALSAATVQRPSSSLPSSAPKPDENFLSPREKAIAPSPQPQASEEKIGYTYPKPEKAFPLPSRQQNVIVAVRKSQTPEERGGYQYPRPDKPFPLPSRRQNAVAAPPEPQASEERVGYRYPKPSKPFPLPSERESVIAAPSLNPSPSTETGGGYRYPRPEESLPSPSGYKYPKPATAFVLPNDGNSSPTGDSTGKRTPSSLRDSGSAEFIPVNKLERKRQAPADSVTKLGFGQRLGTRVRRDGFGKTL